MHRIDGAGHENNLFVSEDPATNRPPTEITPEIMNALQEELATFIEWAGLVLGKADNTQLKQAMLAKFSSKTGIQTQENTAFTTTGDTGVFVLTPNPAITAYGAGQRFRVKFHAVGNGADTINVSGLGAKSLKQYDSKGAKVAAVIAASQLADVEYDGVDMMMLDSLPASTGITAPHFDASLLWSTTEFVKLNRAGLAGIVGKAAAGSIALAEVGKLIELNAAAAQALPLAADVPAGNCVFLHSTIAGASVVRAGTDVIYTGVGANSVTSIPVNTGEHLILASNGVNAWYIVGGSAALAFADYFSTGACYQKTGKVIRQWGTASVNSTVTFPIAFPTAVQSVVVSPLAANNGSGQEFASPNTISNTQFQIAGDYAGTAYWIAIGY